MALKDELRQQGEWLFRKRSHLPLALTPLLVPVMYELRDGVPALWMEPWWQLCCLALGLTGLIVRGVAVGHAAPGTSGRNTHGQKAEDLNTTGLYATVRHPLYLGNFLLFLGVVLFPGVWWFTLLAALVYWLYYERIMYAEESFLLDKYGETFSKWANTTPAIVPNLRRWQRPLRPFSPRKALRGEYPTVLGFIATLAGFDTLIRSLYREEFDYSIVWATGLGVAMLFYITVRILIKRTRILHGK